eukprot:5354711-Prymnesium_polylepis.1
MTRDSRHVDARLQTENPNLAMAGMGNRIGIGETSQERDSQCAPHLRAIDGCAALHLSLIHI